MSNEHHSYTSESNGIIKFLWNVLFVVFYPLITTFSLLFVGLIYVFSGFSKLVSRISASTEGIEIKKPEWQPFVQCGKYELDRIYVDEIMFGPAYYNFRANPEAPSLKGKLFGDFKFPFGPGMLLQQWNSTNVKEVPDFQLVFFNEETGSLTELRQIKSFSWNLQETKEGEVTIKWFTGTEGGEEVIRLEDLEC